MRTGIRMSRNAMSGRKPRPRAAPPRRWPLRRRSRARATRRARRALQLRAQHRLVFGDQRRRSRVRRQSPRERNLDRRARRRAAVRSSSEKRPARRTARRCRSRTLARPTPWPGRPAAWTSPTPVSVTVTDEPIAVAARLDAHAAARGLRLEAVRDRVLDDRNQQHGRERLRAQLVRRHRSRIRAASPSAS